MKTTHSLQHPRTPTQDDLRNAAGKTVPDVIAPELWVLFCGINPGLYSAAAGHHFARPGNRFWPALHAAGFTDRLLSPYEERELLQRGYGITNLVERATASAAELSPAELLEGGHRLEAKLRRYRPKTVAILGIEAYRRAFRQRAAALGQQRDKLENAVVWVLPNPSGLNAHYQLVDLAARYRELLLAITS